MVEYMCGWCVDGEVCVDEVCVWWSVCGGVCVDGVCEGRGWRELEGA